MKSAERAGFTLIELMIVVAIVGILSSIAIPTFRVFVLRSKTAEATQNLDALFKNASSYYTSERAAKGLTGTLQVGCTVGNVGPLPAAPLAKKQKLPSDPGFIALGFNVGDYIYYSYGVRTETSLSTCDGLAKDPTVYTLFANGDLDGDSKYSTFELVVGSDANNELYHARGLYIMSELD